MNNTQKFCVGFLLAALGMAAVFLLRFAWIREAYASELSSLTTFAVIISCGILVAGAYIIISTILDGKDKTKR